MSPPFLYDGPGSSGIGQLVLGSPAATHTIEFQNDLIFLSDVFTTITRQVACRDGAAAVDARISGDGIQNDLAKTGVFLVSGDGTLEMAGDLLGRFSINQNGQGTTILSGNNSGLNRQITVTNGTLVFANDASLGDPTSITVLAGSPHSELDATALSGPLTLSIPGPIRVDGRITGDVRVNDSLTGNGEIIGNVAVPAGSRLEPSFDGTLEINGDLDLASGSTARFDLFGTGPEIDHNRLRVSGAVNLAGGLFVSGSDDLAVGDELIVLLNAGTDPINGTFAGWPEGATMDVAPGLAVQITYLANGDGGTVGNDVAFTVIVGTISSDLSLTGNAPLIVPPGAEILVNFTITNSSFNLIDDTELEITFSNADFVSSNPPGILNGTTLTIPLPPLFPFDSTLVSLRLTAPAAATSVTVNAELIDSFNPSPLDSYTGVTAVLPGGIFQLESFTANPGTGTVTLGIETLENVTYLLQSSTTLKPDEWSDDLYFIGDGTYTTVSPTIDKPKEFFRIGIVPYGSSGGSGGEGP